MKITLKNGNVYEVESGLSAFAIARQIDPEMAKASLVCEINGKMPASRYGW